MAKLISYVCILICATMAGPTRVEPQSGLADLALLQCNLQKSIAASTELEFQMNTNSDDVANYNTIFVFVTEPYVSTLNCKIKLPHTPMNFIPYVQSNFIKPSPEAKSGFDTWPRAAMFARRDVVSHFVPQISSRDICVIQTIINCRPTFLVSGYLDQNVMEIPKSLVKLLDNLGNHGLILALDTNSHSTLWSCQTTTPRGEMVESMLAKYNLYLLNKGNTKTFIGSQGATIIDITVCDQLTSRYISKWRVDTKENFSDH